MSRTQTPLERSGLRKAVLQLASLQLLALLLLGLLSLFAVWSLDRVHERDLRELAGLAQAVDIGRAAQVDVKLQVQEWKNTLLRGSDPVQFDRYAAASRAARDRAGKRLGELRTRLAVMGMQELAERVDATLLLHGSVSAAYEAGFQRLAAGHASVVEIDGSIRGVDRPLDEAIDGLVLSLAGSVQPRITTLGSASHDRFEILMRALWVVLAAVAVMVSFGVWRIIGGSRTTEA